MSFDTEGLDEYFNAERMHIIAQELRAIPTFQGLVMDLDSLVTALRGIANRLERLDEK